MGLTLKAKVSRVEYVSINRFLYDNTYLLTIFDGSAYDESVKKILIQDGDMVRIYDVPDHPVDPDGYHSPVLNVVPLDHDIVKIVFSVQINEDPHYPVCERVVKLCKLEDEIKIDQIKSYIQSMYHGDVTIEFVDEKKETEENATKLKVE